MPWVQIRETKTIGPLRLLPYRAARMPGDLPHVTQQDIDGVLAAYAVRPGRPIHEATILEFGDWQSGQEFSGYEVEFYRLRDLIAFCALAERKLFRGHMSYCNFDAYACIAQRFNPGDTKHFSFITRRRDGGTQSLWGADDFAFTKPLHVPDNVRIDIDEDLFVALLDHAPIGSSLHSAIIDFNRANTDSSDVPPHVELVMMKSAFEYLFEIDTRDVRFVQALNNCIATYAIRAAGGAKVQDLWREKRPKAGRLLDSWAYEFCDWRGGAAHGKKRGGDRYLWSEASHLAFGSILFPLLVRQDLVRRKLLTDNERKSIELEMIEEYLVFEPFAEIAYDGQQRHAWSTVVSDLFVGERMTRHMRRVLGA